MTTTTITTLFRLERHDVILVEFHTEKNHGESKLVSNNFKAIHFIEMMIERDYPGPAKEEKIKTNYWGILRRDK